MKRKRQTNSEEATNGSQTLKISKRRLEISLRRRTDQKKNAANDGREAIQQFHRDLGRAVQSKKRRHNKKD